MVTAYTHAFLCLIYHAHPLFVFHLSRFTSVHFLYFKYHAYAFLFFRSPFVDFIFDDMYFSLPVNAIYYTMIISDDVPLQHQREFRPHCDLTVVTIDERKKLFNNPKVYYY